MKKVKRKHRWATVKGKVVSVRFSDVEYEMVERRARGRGMSIGAYLKWLTRVTRDSRRELEIEGVVSGAGDEDRTRDPLLGKQMLYH